MNDEAKKKFLDALKKGQQALSVAIKLIKEGELMPIEVSQGPSAEDTKITLSIPPEATATIAGVKSIKFRLRPHFSELTIRFE